MTSLSLAPNETAGAAPALMDTYRRWPVRFVSGRGATLVDEHGKEYLDLTAGIAVASTGHCHPAVTAAIREQAGRLVHVSNLYETDPAAALAERLSGLTGGMRSFFCNSGAEAVEAALKLARRYGGHRRTIVAASGGFHGRTMGALSVTGQPAKRAPFEPLVGGVVHVPFGDVRALADALGPGVAAVLLEPIQGEAGVIVPPEPYLAEVRRLCDESGALLILDEVQTGIARTGRWFAYEHAGVTPDILCLAKGLGAGLPIGACLARPDVAASFGRGDHGSTFGGGPVPAAAALAVLQVVEHEGLVERARVAGELLAAGLESAFRSAPVRGRGLLLAAALPQP
ncbi:MAG: acetylornithine/succinylornithine family transaminase, partial [Actinomycetota bacterium]|nr:acetylornithine/succinylornithine family transaminase [Actinomycetota bacterium]